MVSHVPVPGQHAPEPAPLSLPAWINYHPQSGSSLPGGLPGTNHILKKDG
ncbi:17360_t:CDS:2 [Rhizophagus irregularis]|nr:17360_t:CDS:2 [Rhizophagus irregularis]